MLISICDADAYCEYPKILMPNTKRMIRPLLDDFMTSNHQNSILIQNKKNPDKLCKSFDLLFKLIRANKINQN